MATTPERSMRDGTFNGVSILARFLAGYAQGDAPASPARSRRCVVRHRRRGREYHGKGEQRQAEHEREHEAVHGVHYNSPSAALCLP